MDQIPMKAPPTHLGDLHLMSMGAGQSSPATALPLQGRAAIVTGAGRGIGLAIAAHLASLGCHVLINNAADAAQADLLVSELNTSCPAPPSSSPPRPRAMAFRADVSDAADVKAMFDAAEEAFGGPAHILVVCAGVLDAKYATLAATADEDWDAAFAVNARGAFLCCREAANRLVRGGGGRIITISTSLVGALRPGYAAYAASKAAEAMTKILAKELQGTGITANSVAPGPVASDLFFVGKSEADVKRAVDMIPLGRLGQPEDIAPVVGFLATDAAEWVNGQVIRANGGYV